jgi:hypothetical protein
MNENERINPQIQVEVFGEFTDSPWMERIQCKYDRKTQCFAADVRIKSGQQFKFILENGKNYVTSRRYQIIHDNQGNTNNKLVWGRSEKKKPRKFKGSPYDKQNYIPHP